MNLPEWAKYVARDRSGSLWVFKDKPYKHYGPPETQWLIKSGECQSLPRELFPHVSWSDKEPTYVYDSIIKPDHYLNEDGQDLFEQWYHRYPFTTFLAVMECIEERYSFRASRKNGEEDLRKAQEVRDRKLEYIKRHQVETAILFGLPDDPTYMPMPD